jgi:Protein of unknown function (DUF1254)
MKLNVLAPLFSAGLSGLLIAPTAAQSAITEEEAHAIGVQAYLYFYSLVTMDVTRRQLTNVQRPEDIRTPANSFVSLREYPSADLRLVVRPNFDTLYTTGFLDTAAATSAWASAKSAGGFLILFGVPFLRPPVFRPQVILYFSLSRHDLCAGGRSALHGEISVALIAKPPLARC